MSKITEIGKVRLNYGHYSGAELYSDGETEKGESVVEARTREQ
jgi:hypothetical protein